MKMISFKRRFASAGRGAGRTLVVACIVALAACSSPEDKARKSYEKGVALLEKGEPDKARIEFQRSARPQSSPRRREGLGSKA